MSLRENLISKKLLNLLSIEYSFSDFFTGINVNKIQIYKHSTFSDIVYKNLKKDNFNISFIDNFEEIDKNSCVIISDYEQYLSLYEQISKYTETILSVKELIDFVNILVTLDKFDNLCIAKKYIVRYPLFPYDFQPKSFAEAIIKGFPLDTNRLASNPLYFKYLFSDIEEYSDEYIKNIYANAPVVKEDGVYKYLDYSSKYLNIVNGVRYTVGNPEEYYNSVYFLGACHVFGMGAEDKHTISSVVQSHTNKSKCINIGMWDIDDYEKYDLLKKYNFNKEDVLFLINSDIALPRYNNKLLYNFFCNYLSKYNISYIDLSEIFENVDLSQILVDSGHTNYRGYKIIGDYLYDTVVSKIDYSSMTLKKQCTNNISNNTYSDIALYTDYLISEKIDSKGIIGSIVINANPFTQGHKYLVEKALEKCDFLYIFVLEEDKSFFKFIDRYNIVIENLKNNSKVKILKSGNYIISNLTLTEYFSKEQMQTATIDATMDLSIFGEKIAPVLNITKRFAGTEPYCNITKQYNEGMASILKNYNIEFIEIDRFSIDNDIISATKVRNYIKNKELDKAKKYLTTETYNYIKNNDLVFNEDN